MIGRKEEQKRLSILLKEERSHFVAVYGRRRVGKTYLIREFFKNKFTFHITGMANVSLKIQLNNVHIALQNAQPNQILQQAQNWLMAFQQLIRLLEQSKEKKKIVFIDELPWMDTPRSNFLSAFEHFWNSWASARKDIFLVASGSSASWMLNALINNKGGLHNRVTARIKLNPFTLQETAQLLKQKNVNYTKYQIIQVYMAFGGIPFYLEQIDREQSAMQNIDRLCFGEHAIFRDEYSLLFKSLFKKADNHMKVIEAIASANQGISRSEIINKTGFTNGGGLTAILSELIESNFIRKYHKTGQKSRDVIYQLVDSFSLFHNKFIKSPLAHTDNQWLNIINSPKYYAWAGNAFEIVCLQHIAQIKKALGISGVQTQVSTWRNENAQIDLVIDRKDDVINLVEIKFSEATYTISKNYEVNLRNKLNQFRLATKTKKALWIVILTTFGLKENKYTDIVQKNLTMDVLFE